MHSLASYTMRATNSDVPKKTKQSLDKLGAHDAFEKIVDFIKGKGDNFYRIDSKKTVYRFSEFKYDKEKRIFYGWFSIGHYGEESEIIDIGDGEVVYVKSMDKAEIINHFFHFYIPKGYDEAIVLLHSIRGKGIKTILTSILNMHFYSNTNYNLLFNPISYAKALKEWNEANTKEIRLINFESPTDIADGVRHLGCVEHVHIMKAPRRGKLGLFKDFITKGSDQHKAVELLSPLCSSVKTVVELNGRKRTFVVGASSSGTICEIEAPEEIEYYRGNPKYCSMVEWCSEVTNELSESTYPKSRG